MRTLIIMLWSCVCLVLSGCTAAPATLALPTQPIYVIAGQRAVPGYAPAEVSIVDRTTLKPVGSRPLALSYIREALYDGSHLWYGYAGDIDIDMHTVAQLSPDLATEAVYEVCTEPNGIHDDGDAIIVLCTQNGMVAHATRIRKDDGTIIADTDIVTKWGDMMYIDSVLFNGELIVYGGGNYQDVTDRTAQELQIRDPRTLALRRIVEMPETEIGMDNFIVTADSLYILNNASKYATEYGFAPVDLMKYTAGSTAVEILPNIGRSPTDGVITNGFLYTVHNIGNNIDYSPVSIYRTNLTTMEHQHWEFDGAQWSFINDISVIDGRIIIALPRTTDPEREGLYEFDPSTGALLFRSAIPGASLIVDTQSERTAMRPSRRP